MTGKRKRKTKTKQSAGSKAQVLLRLLKVSFKKAKAV